MRCRVCGKDNPNDADICSNCGKPLYNNGFRLELTAVIVGTIVSLIFVAVSSVYAGSETTIFYGMMPVAFIGGCVTSVLAYKKKEIDSNNTLSNATITGIVLNIAVIIGFLITSNSADGGPFILIIFLPGCIVASFMGGILGSVINVVREKGPKWIISTALILILVTITIGYAANEFFANEDYDLAYGNQLDSLAFDELLQPAADAFLNAKTDTSEQRMSNLKEADAQYQRMKEITQNNQHWNKKMVKDSTSNIKKEYAQALGNYTNLKYGYYTEMEAGINLTLTNNTKEAETHYQNAKNLQPQIQNQENILTTLPNRDQGFKQYTDQKIAESKQFAKSKIDELMTFQFFSW